MDHKSLSFYFLFIIAISSRLIPHLPNLSILIIINMIVANWCTKKLTICFIISTLFISDSLLGWLYHYPCFGLWSFYTWGSAIIVALCASYLPKNRPLIVLLSALPASLSYWCLTNLGVWLTSNLYSHTVAGFLRCYVMAVPFLVNQILGLLAIFLAYSLFWSSRQIRRSIAQNFSTSRQLYYNNKT